jgi:hypothetical protein
MQSSFLLLNACHSFLADVFVRKLAIHPTLQRFLSNLIDGLPSDTAQSLYLLPQPCTYAWRKDHKLPLSLVHGFLW